MGIIKCIRDAFRASLIHRSSKSDYGVAAVNDQIRAGGEQRSVGSKVCVSTDEVFGVTQTAALGHHAEPYGEHIGHGGYKIGLDITGADAVDADAILDPFNSERLCELDNTGLAISF